MAAACMWRSLVMDTTLRSAGAAVKHAKYYYNRMLTLPIG
jgi:hypothetical protein